MHNVKRCTYIINCIYSLKRRFPYNESAVLQKCTSEVIWIRGKLGKIHGIFGQAGVRSSPAIIRQIRMGFLFRDTDRYCYCDCVSSVCETGQRKIVRVRNLSPALGRGIDSRNRVWNWVAKLHYRLAGRYDNPMPTGWVTSPHSET